MSANASAPKFVRAGAQAHLIGNAAETIGSMDSLAAINGAPVQDSARPKVHREKGAGQVLL